MGIEPTASSMRPKRSSQLSYTPGGTVTVPPEPSTVGSFLAGTASAASLQVWLKPIT